MKNHTVIKKAIAATLLSAAFATPAAVLTAGAAGARPIEGSCGAIAQSMQDSSHMADVAYAQGDRKAGDAHMLDAHRALGNYNRKCLEQRVYRADCFSPPGTTALHRSRSCQLHKYWVRDGEVEDVDSIADLHAGETAFTAADLSGKRVRAVVSDLGSLGKPGEIQLVSYETGLGHPLSVAVWIRHDPVSSVLHFDLRGGSTVVREESIETDEHTSSFGGCWC